LEQKFKITINDFTKHLGINIDHLNSGAVKLRQRKLSGSQFEEYPPTGRRVNEPQHISRNDATKTVNDQGNQPCEQREYLHLFGMLNYISHTRQIFPQHYPMLQLKTKIQQKQTLTSYC